MIENTEKWTGNTSIAGREYITLPLLIKPRKVKAKGKEYYQYIAYIPKQIAKKLYHKAQKQPVEELPVTVLITPMPWHHGLDWKEYPHAYSQLPKEIKLELEALGLAPKQEHVLLTVLAKPHEIKELGIDFTKPITLEELKKKIVEKYIMKKIVAVSRST